MGDLGRRESTLSQLLISFLGINFFYLLYGYIQEHLNRPDSRADGKRFDNSLFLFGIQCFVNASFALIARFLFGRTSPPSMQAKPLNKLSHSSPLRAFAKVNGYVWLAFVSLSYLLAMLSSNEALRYVSYPAQALAKSCKMVPVMLGNVLVGVKYGAREYLTVFVITAGVSVFQMADQAKAGKESTMLGMALLLFSLTLDGVTGSHQHLLDREYQMSTHDLMFGMNAFAFAFTLVALVATGEGERGIKYVLQYPYIQQDILLFALASAFGQNFIFYTITGPGPLACTMITTTRKFFTILLSVLAHPENSLLGQQWLGVFLVFVGLGSEIFDKMSKDRTKRHHKRHDDHDKKHDGSKNEGEKIKPGGGDGKNSKIS